MMAVAGLDIGSSRLKISTEDQIFAVVGATPVDPWALLEAVHAVRQANLSQSPLVGLSSFRRALVIVKDGIPSLSWARDGLALPQTVAGSEVPLEQRLWPVWRWRHAPKSADVYLFEDWLSAELTGGERVISRTAATLSGLWNVAARRWDACVLASLGLTEPEMPSVADVPVVHSGWILPALADHQATLSVALHLVGCVGLVEIGTALAVLAWPNELDVEGSATGAPGDGYVELIDAHHSRRREGEALAPPAWMPGEAQTDAADVVVGALLAAGLSDADGWIAVSGGGATPDLISRVQDRVSTELVVAHEVSSAAGAALFGMRSVERRRFLDRIRTEVGRG